MLKKILKSTQALFFGAFVGLLALSAPQIHNYYMHENIGSSVVKVLNPSGRGGGTGFAVKGGSGKDYIVTNSHVCDAQEDGWMLIKSDRGFSAFKEVIYQDENHDICLIEGDNRLDPLDVGSAPEVGDYNWIVGHPGLRSLTVSQGEFVGNSQVKLAFAVSNESQCKGEFIKLDPLTAFFYRTPAICIITYKSYATTAVAYGGNSGSPVVDIWGNVIGILFAGNTEQERDNHMVPVTELKRVLRIF